MWSNRRRSVGVLAAVVAALGVTACTHEATSSSSTTVPPTPEKDSYGGTQITLGETAPVTVPFDAELVIVVPTSWRDAATVLRCSATYADTGREIELDRPRGSSLVQTDPDWIPLWAMPSLPTLTLNVRCEDPESKIPTTSGKDIRVEPRGMYPIAAN